jgi:hypothetical protein
MTVVIGMLQIVTCRPIARQHIPAESNARNNSTLIARQRMRKHALSTIEGLCFLHGPFRGVIKGGRWSFELVVRSGVHLPPITCSVRRYVVALLGRLRNTGSLSGDISSDYPPNTDMVAMYC